MPPLTPAKLEDAERDADDLGAIVNDPADRSNPGHADGTVTTRTGGDKPTVSKLLGLIAAEEETASAAAVTAVGASTAAEGYATDAEAARDELAQSVDAVAELYDDSQQTLGQAGALANPGGAVMNQGLYIFGDKPISAGAVASLTGYIRTTSGVTLKPVKGTKSGDPDVVSAGDTITPTGKETLTPGATGQQTLVSTLTFNGDEWLGLFTMGGPLGSITAAVPGAGMFKCGTVDVAIGTPSAAAVDNPATTQYQVRLLLDVVEQIVTGARLLTDEADIDTLQAGVTQAQADIVTNSAGLDAARIALAKIFDEPNLALDPEGQLVGVTGSTVWVGTNKPTVVSANGERAFRYQNGENGELSVPVSAFGGPGATMSVSLWIEQLTRASGSIFGWLRFYNSAGAEISHVSLYSYSATLAAATEVKQENIAIPAGTASVALFTTSAAASNLIAISRICMVRGAKGGFRPVIYIPKRRIVHIGPAGSDNNEGTYAAPFATAQRALQFLRDPDFRSSGIVELLPGDYPSLTFPCGPIQSAWPGMIGELTVRAMVSGTRTRAIHGTLLAGITKTPGFTNVYQVTMATAISPSASTGGAKFIFEDGTEESSIAIADRKPCHTGRSHRSPSTAMRVASPATIAGVDGTLGRFWFDTATPGSGTGTLYFSTPDGSDPTTNGRSYYVPSAFRSNGDGFGVCGFGALGDSGYFSSINGGAPGYLRVEGVGVWYAARGFDVRGIQRSELIDCEAVGNRFHSLYSGEGWTETHNFRAIRSGQDNFGGPANVSTFPEYGRPWRSIHRAPYAYGAGDDNLSSHEFHYLEAHGGHFEYADDSGCAIVLGCDALFTDCEFWDNYKDPDPGGTGANGEGIGLRQLPPGAEGGVNSTVRAVNCISGRNRYNFAVAGGGNALQLQNPLSYDAITYGFMLTNSGDYMGVRSSGSNVGNDVRKLVAAGATLYDPQALIP